MVLDDDDAPERPEWASESLVGGGGGNDVVSGEGEPDDLDVEVDEWAERRFERRGSLGDSGGAMLDIGHNVEGLSLTVTRILEYPARQFPNVTFSHAFRAHEDVCHLISNHHPQVS